MTGRVAIVCEVALTVKGVGRAQFPHPSKHVASSDEFDIVLDQVIAPLRTSVAGAHMEEVLAGLSEDVQCTSELRANSRALVRKNLLVSHTTGGSVGHSGWRSRARDSIVVR